MHVESPGWRSPGFGRLFRSGLLAGLVGGVACGLLFIVLALGLSALDRASLASLGVGVLALVIYFPFACAAGAVVGLLVSVVLAPLLALWLGRNDLAGQPVAVVARQARWRAVAFTLIVVAVADVAALDIAWPDWLTWFILPSLLIITWAWFASGQIVVRAAPRRVALPDTGFGAP